MCGCLQRPKDARTPKTEITSSCEMPDVGAGIQARVPWKL